METCYARFSIPARLLDDPSVRERVQRILALKPEEITATLAERPLASAFTGCSDLALRLIGGHPFLVLEEDEASYGDGEVSDHLCDAGVPHLYWRAALDDRMPLAAASIDAAQHIITTDLAGDPIARVDLVGSSHTKPQVVRENLAAIEKYARARAAVIALAAPAQRSAP